VTVSGEVSACRPRPVAHENRVGALTCRFVDWSRGLVFVDEAAEDRSSLDPPASEADDRGGNRRVRVRAPLAQALVRPMPVVVDRILG
jgi:hypothetical protein